MGALLQHTIFGRQKVKQFVSTWKTDNISTGSSTASQVKLPLVSSGTYNMLVDWGDGTSNTVNIWNVGNTHTYSISGTYTIKISGTCTGWQFNNTGDRLKILSISSWGSLGLGNLGHYFYGCANINLSSVTDILNLTGTADLGRCFLGCTVLTTIGRVNEWNTASVTNMAYMFQQASNFNDNISSWNTASVTNMGFMFYSTKMNNSINSWNTGNVTNMNSMFALATLFNQNIGSISVSKVGDFTSMFDGASAFNNGGNASINNWSLKTDGIIAFNTMFRNAISFNQNIDSWNTVAVTNMSSMFQNATSFNNGLASGLAGTMTWNTIAVTTMQSMFAGAIKFNQNIGSWDLANTTTIASMFSGATVFNNGGDSSINGWNTVKVTNLNLTFFNAVSFNQPVGSWTTTLVVNMSGTFYLASAFNQDLSGWNTIAVTIMSETFRAATAFNQNIGGWNISNVTVFSSFMTGKTPATFSATNLDAIYNGWSSRPVKPNIIITFGTAKYTAGASAGRAILTGAPNNWSIVDGGI